MKKIIFLLVTMAMLVACDDTTDKIGLSLTDTSEQLSVVAQEFFLETKSVKASETVSRSSNGCLGKIQDPETGANITAGFMTQLRQFDGEDFPQDSIVDYEGKGTTPIYESIVADSCIMYVYFPQYYGDTLALMNTTCHELAIPYEESKSYPTTYNPMENGMIRTGAGSIHKKVSYTHTDLIKSASSRKDNIPQLDIALNDKYIDKDGKEYNNFGTYLLRKYYTPSTQKDFETDYRFVHNICPGFYLEHTGGKGCMLNISMTRLFVYYHRTLKSSTGTDSVLVGFTPFVGSPEVIQHTYIQNDENKINDLLSNNDCTYLKSPAGIYTEITLPIDDIMKGHETDSLTSARVYISSLNNVSTSQYNLAAASNILLLPADSVDTFFAKRSISTLKGAYLTSYSSKSNGFIFDNISSLVNTLYKNKVEGMKSDNNWTSKNPNWNKLYMIPVEATYTTMGTSKMLSRVAQDMTVRSTKLVKGDGTNKNVSMSVLYSKFKNN